MCGISGLVSNEVFDGERVRNSVRAIEHRGPDDKGFFESKNCMFGMCRLAIIDVRQGMQPSYNKTRDVVSIFNGELYNFMNLRTLLLSRGHQIESLGDSALIPYLYQEFGEKFPNLLNGMFAIAIYDLKKEQLTLVRDRFGKKPLWFHCDKNGLLFSSELKGLFALGVKPEFDSTLLPEYLRYGYINAPRSPYLGIKQVPPASILVYKNNQFNITEYWKASEVEPLKISLKDARVEGERLLSNAITLRRVSERPLGVFLSGGVDSSIVTALLSKSSDESIHSFSIGFDDDEFDESQQSQKIAKILGTVHHAKIVAPDPLLIINKLAKIIDQPFADSSIIPTFLLSQFAREHVIVALSGDGGDEVFGGYPRYRFARYLDLLNPLLASSPVGILNSLSFRNIPVGKLGRHLTFLTLEERYRRFQSLFHNNDLMNLLSSDIIENPKTDYFSEMWNSTSSHNRLRRMQEIDLRSYLPGDLMYKIDIASMANGMEVRSPFLDYRVVEFGLSLPEKIKVNMKQEKVLMRDLAKQYLPAEIIDQPKKGFGIPRAKWLRGELREVVSDILLDTKSKSRGWFNIKTVSEVIDLHNRGKDLDNLIWPLFMLELWARNWLD